jgi:hypothetical protein
MSEFPLCQSADIDERAIRREEPEQLVKALAEAKVRASRWTVMLFLLVFFFSVGWHAGVTCFLDCRLRPSSRSFMATLLRSQTETNLPVC